MKLLFYSCAFIVLTTTITCCNLNKGNSQSIKVNRKTLVTKKGARDDFDSFFYRFKTDSLFQLSRVKFPLKLTVIDDDGDTIKLIQKKDWRFIFHQKEDKEIVKKIVTGENMVNVDLMIEDTGVSINHYFVNTNGKWLLTAIKDASD
ncbi:hypothetical protein BH09BAC6_BH09BAC6_04200 [soil metagenome]|jgi:hypothetical protein